MRTTHAEHIWLHVYLPNICLWWKKFKWEEELRPTAWLRHNLVAAPGKDGSEKLGLSDFIGHPV